MYDDDNNTHSVFLRTCAFQFTVSCIRTAFESEKMREIMKNVCEHKLKCMDLNLQYIRACECGKRLMCVNIKEKEFAFAYNININFTQLI